MKFLTVYESYPEATGDKKHSTMRIATVWVNPVRMNADHIAFLEDQEDAEGVVRLQDKDGDDWYTPGRSVDIARVLESQ